MTTCCLPWVSPRQATIAIRSFAWLQARKAPARSRSLPAWPTIPIRWKGGFAGSWTDLSDARCTWGGSDWLQSAYWWQFSCLEHVGTARHANPHLRKVLRTRQQRGRTHSMRRRPRLRPRSPATISGRVVTASGEPVHDATVTLPNWGDKAPLAVSRTKADGTFSLVLRDDSNLPHRRSHPLCISAKGFAATYVHQRHLTVFPGGRKDLGDIRVFPGEIFRGRVVDPAGNAIAGAKVTCSTVRYELGHTCAEVGFPYETTTDSQGRYETHRMPLGSRWVMVQAEGFQLAVLDEEVFKTAGKKGTSAFEALA